MTHRAPIEPAKRQRPWYAVDPRRAAPAARGYDARWRAASERYRTLHPLCVPCLLGERVRPSTCVDHIVPAHSCAALFWEPMNWCAMCNRCHGRKTRLEPQHSWEPRSDRIVLCGLPGTGKTTRALATGFAVWDADDYPGLRTAQAIIDARDRWLAVQRGSMAVIVASPVTASTVAGQICGLVEHLTERHAERSPRAAE